MRAKLEFESFECDPGETDKDLKRSFSVFDSNAATLGRLSDTELRSKIVTVYSGLKALVDTVNHYSEREQLWMNLSRQTEKIGLSELKGDVEGRAVNIRGFVPELEVKIADLLTGIGKYLARR